MVFIKMLQTKTAINASRAMLNDLISFQIKYNAAMSFLGPVHMIPGQLIASGQLTEPWATSRGGLPVVQYRVTRLAEVTFLHVNRTQKLSRSKSSLAHAHY